MLISLACWTSAATATPASAAVVDFDDLPLGPESHWSGPDPAGTVVPGAFGSTEVHGSFTSRGVQFVNRHNLTFGSWSGFAYSNHTDTLTPGFGNQYSAFAGSGRSPGADNYGVAFGYDDLAPNGADPVPFDPTSAADLRALPSFTLPEGSTIIGMHVTNTTYAARSMLEGDSFANKFGGATGNDPDWLKLTAFGIDAFGVPLSGFVELYLADYRFADNSLDYLLDDWTPMDLSPLAGAKSLHFNLSSSDVGDFGLNTPPYFAVDDIEFIAPAAVPEPSAAILLGGLLIAAGAARRFRRRTLAE